MTTAFQRNAFQDNAFQIDDVVVTTTLPPEGAGGIAGSRGSYGPAFPRRSVRDLYRQLPPVVEPEQSETEQPKSEDKLTEAQLSAPSPLPVIMALGGIPITIGLQAPSLNAALQNAILLDDEDAIIAILLSV